jgi:hypothetical protein
MVSSSINAGPDDTRKLWLGQAESKRFFDKRVWDAHD